MQCPRYPSGNLAQALESSGFASCFRTCEVLLGVKYKHLAWSTEYSPVKGHYTQQSCVCACLGELRATGVTKSLL